MRWFEVPVLWLAAACLLLSLLGCIANIMISLEYADVAMAEAAPSSRFQLLTTGHDPKPIEPHER